MGSFLTLLGGLGLFLFGMRTMSAGLQKVAGEKLRGLLALFTKNRFAGILSGFLMTCGLQSSSATTVMIVSFSSAGLLTLTQAIGPVMGANIGTTITAYIASIGANRAAKRVARSHLLFNVIGVLWVLPILYPFTAMLRSVVPGGVTIQLAAFHSSFNIINTGVLMWFIPQIQRITEWWIPYTDAEKDEIHIRYFDAGLQQTPELAVVEVRRALQTMTALVHDMFCQIQSVIRHPEKRLGDLVDEIKRGEDKTDHMEAEIIEFCTELARQSTSPQVAREIAAGFDMANDVERMGDHCFNLILLAQRAYDNKYGYSEASRESLNKMMQVVEEFMALTTRALEPASNSVLSEAKVLENKINTARDQARKAQAELMRTGELEIRAGLVYLDMMNNFEKLGDYCHNVAEMVSKHMQPR